MRCDLDFCSHKYLRVAANRVATDRRDDMMQVRPTRAMRVTIIKRPHRYISEIYFRTWRVGETYDVSPDIATLLIAEGWGRLEMRSGLDRRKESRPSAPTRRTAENGAPGHRW